MLHSSIVGCCKSTADYKKTKKLKQNKKRYTPTPPHPQTVKGFVPENSIFKSGVQPERLVVQYPQFFASVVHFTLPDLKPSTYIPEQLDCPPPKKKKKLKRYTFPPPPAPPSHPPPCKRFCSSKHHFQARVQCRFTSTETVRPIRDEQDGHLDFHTAPEL